MNPYRFAGDRNMITRYQAKYVRLFQEGERVLDLGCGQAIFLELLREHGVAAIGVDVFQEAVETGREKGLDVRCDNALTFVEQTTEYFDGIFMAHLIEHFPVERVEQFLNQCYQILKPGGRLVIVTPNTFDIEVLTERFWLDPTHRWPYPPLLLEALIREAGFDVLSVGDDPDTGLAPRRLPLRGKARYWLYKLRFGRYFGRGDTAVIARRTK